MSVNTLAESTKTLEKEVSFGQALKKAVLALQHLIAMFGATVLVPILTGLDPSVALVSAGIGTLIFHYCTKKKVPVFLGSSFAFISVIIQARERYGDLAYAQGGMVIVGLLYIMFAFFIKKIGVEKIQRFLPSQVVGPMIMVIGLTLLPTAIGMASSNYMIAIITLGTALGVTFFAKGFIKQLSILIAVIVGYIMSVQFGIIDSTPIAEAALVAIPNFTLPKFHIGAISMIAPIVLAVFMEHVGDITTNGEVVGQNFIEDPGLNRTLLGDGIATLVAGLMGGPANTTYGENTGVLAITKNYDPSILRLAAVFAIILGFVAKVGGFLRSIPTPVMGGISVMLFSMISLVGVNTIRNSKVQFNVKNIIIMATILILGLGAGFIEKHTGIYVGIALSETVQIQGLSFAAIIGVVLNIIFNRKAQNQ